MPLIVEVNTTMMQAVEGGGMRVEFGFQVALFKSGDYDYFCSSLFLENKVVHVLVCQLELE